MRLCRRSIGDDMPDTIQQCIEGDYAIRVICHGPQCTNDQSLDLKALAERLGPNHGAMHVDLADKFRCSKCGSKKVSFRITPNASARPLTETAWTGRKR